MSSFTETKSDFIMVREFTLYDFNYFKFVEVCLWPRIWPMLVNVSIVIWKNVYSTVLGIDLYTCLLHPVGWWLILLLSSFIFLLILSIDCMRCWEWGVELADYNWSCDTKRIRLPRNSQSISQLISKRASIIFSIL